MICAVPFLVSCGCHLSNGTVIAQNESTEIIQPSSGTDTQKSDSADTELHDASDANSNEVPQNPAPTKSAREYIDAHVSDIVAGAVLAYPYQHDIVNPDLNTALYMMRAARYAEAADIAGRIEPQTRATQFIAAKASILSQKCTSESPVSGTLKALRKSNKSDYLNIIYDYWIVRAYIAEKQYTEAYSGISSFKKNYPSETKQLRELILAYAPAVIASETQDNAQIDKVTQLLKLVESKGNTFEASTALHLRYEIAKRNDQTELANSLARKLVLSYPATQMAQWPELAQNIQSYTPSERYQRALRLIKHFDYADARTELYDLVQNKRLTGKTLDDAEWELARIAMTNTDDPKLSERIYHRIASQSGPRREEATFGIARSLSRQLDYRAALKALDNYIAAYPNGQYAKRTLYLQGWYWFEVRENEKARPYLKTYAERTNDTSVWGFYAQTFIREGKWQEAIRAFEKLKGNSNPIVRGKALYWQAYAHHQLSHDDEAHAHLDRIHAEFPFTYYDILAYRLEERVFGLDFEQTLRERLRWRNNPPEPNCDALLPWGRGCDLSKLATNAVWGQIQTLVAHDDPAQARKLYQQHESLILSGIPENKRSAFKRYASHLTENYNAAWESASGSIRALSSDYPDRASARFQMAYPQAFAPLVESLSYRYGVPRYFIFGIMLQESRFRPWQISTADAIGALQMIPKTATWIAQKLGLQYHPETFFDPKVGFIYSVYYMKMHLDLWHDNLTFTAGSYNGGPHRIGPWMMRDKDKTMDFIVEEFSFDESRHYARKVAEHTLRYLYLYANSVEDQLTVINMLFPREIVAVEPPDGWGI